jgi:outer membrane lipoprotein-sorting protein
LVAQAIASVTIYRQDTDAVPRQIVVVGQKGDRTDITLSDITINPQVSVDAFTLTLGSDVRVTNVGKPAGGTPSDR